MRKISLEGYLCPKSLGFKQILRTMKITLFLLLATTFSAFSVNVHSQNAKVSFDTHTMKVAQLISTIETQTNYLFVYNKKNVDLNRKVTVKARNKAVSEILDEVFSGTGISYVMEGKNIVLTKEASFFLIPIAVTTTVSNFRASSSILMVKLVFPFTGMMTFLYPM